MTHPRLLVLGEFGHALENFSVYDTAPSLLVLNTRVDCLNVLAFCKHNSLQLSRHLLEIIRFITSSRQEVLLCRLHSHLQSLELAGQVGVAHLALQHASATSCVG